MTLIVALLVLTVTAVTVMVLAGREFLRVHDFPPHPVRSVEDVLHLASLGYRVHSAEAHPLRAGSPR